MMQEIRQHKLALSLIALLISIKFIIVPIFSWQDAQLLELQLLQKQNSRIDNVLDHRQEIEDYGASLADALAASADLFLTSNNVATFQLEQQQWLEEKIKEHDLEANNIGWSPPQEYTQSNLVAHKVQLNIDGKTGNILAFMQALQAQAHYIEVSAFSLRFKGQNAQSLGSGRNRLNLIFYRQAASA
jgi:hypothetical protein